MRHRSLWSFAIVYAALIMAGCKAVEKNPKLVTDQRMELQRGELRAVPIEIGQPSELKLEVSNLDGEALYVYLIDRSEKFNLENKLEWRYFTVFSQPNLKDRFDSGWRRIAGPAVYNLILKPHDKDLSESGATQGPTIARVRVLTR